MNTIKVSVSDLKIKVKENREKHEAEYKAALEGWREKCIGRMEHNLSLARSGGEVKTNIGLYEPQSHVRDYDRVISMLEWTQDKIVEFTAEDFDKYVNDNWDWKRDFNLTNSMYLNK